MHLYFIMHMKKQKVNFKIKNEVILCTYLELFHFLFYLFFILLTINTPTSIIGNSVIFSSSSFSDSFALKVWKPSSHLPGIFQFFLLLTVSSRQFRVDNFDSTLSSSQSLQSLQCRVYIASLVFAEFLFKLISLVDFF